MKVALVKLAFPTCGHILHWYLRPDPLAAAEATAAAAEGLIGCLAMALIGCGTTNIEGEDVAAVDTGGLLLLLLLLLA